jgi:hypothetical protein
MTIQVPAVIKETLVGEIGDGGKITSFSKETDADNNDQPFYRAKAVIDGEKYTIDIDTDGTLLGSSADDPDPDPKQLGADDLPAAVKATLHKQAGSAVPTDVSRVDRQADYGMTVKIHGHKYTLHIDAAGRLLSKDLADDEGDVKSRTAA